MSIVYILCWCYLQIPPLLQGSRFPHNNFSSRLRKAVFVGPLARQAALLVGCRRGECSCREKAYINIFLFVINNRKIAIPQEAEWCLAALPRTDHARQHVQLGTKSLNKLKSAASISTMILTHTLWISVLSVKKNFGCRDCAAVYCFVLMQLVMSNPSPYLCISWESQTHSAVKISHSGEKGKQDNFESWICWNFLSSIPSTLAHGLNGLPMLPVLLKKIQDLRHSVILSLKQH